MAFAQKQLFGVLAITCVFGMLAPATPAVREQHVSRFEEPINAEACLARSQKLSVHQATQADLELIRGISEIKATSILRFFRRHEWSALSRQSSEEWKVFAGIKGVGEKGARELLRTLSTEQSRYLCVGVDTERQQK